MADERYLIKKDEIAKGLEFENKGLTDNGIAVENDYFYFIGNCFPIK